MIPVLLLEETLLMALSQSNLKIFARANAGRNSSTDTRKRSSTAGGENAFRAQS